MSEEKKGFVQALLDRLVADKPKMGPRGMKHESSYKSLKNTRGVMGSKAGNDAMMALAEMDEED